MDWEYLLSVEPALRAKLNRAQAAIARWNLPLAIRADSEARALFARAPEGRVPAGADPAEDERFLADLNKAVAEAARGQRAEARRTFYGDTSPAWADGAELAGTTRLDSNSDVERLMSSIRGAVEDLAYLGLVATQRLVPEPWPENTVIATLRLDSFLFDGELEVHVERRQVRFRVREPNGISDGELCQWEILVSRALADFEAGARVTAWRAIIGPIPQFPGRSSSLAGRRYRIGPLTFGPANFVVSERFRMLDGPPFEYQPVVVTGLCTTSHDFGVNAEEEGAYVRRLCALLSLLGETAWTMRVGPGSPGLLDRSAVAPTEFLTRDIAHWGAEPSTEYRIGAGPKGISIPRWMKDAWARAEQDEVLGALLTAYHEARELEYGHPSAALLLYIATLDKFGQLLGAKGSGRRVEAAIRRGCAPSDADRLLHAYGLRNETSHEGLLHALEVSYGLEASPHIGGISRSMPFRFGVLREIREVSRRLVTEALRDGL
jgi:hypothetical protein